MQDGELIELNINGVRGMWERISGPRSTHATPGIKALGEARSKWHKLRSERQGGIASIESCDEASTPTLVRTLHNSQR